MNIAEGRKLIGKLREEAAMIEKNTLAIDSLKKEKAGVILPYHPQKLIELHKEIPEIKERAPRRVQFLGGLVEIKTEFDELNEEIRERNERNAVINKYLAKENESIAKKNLEIRKNNVKAMEAAQAEYNKRIAAFEKQIRETTQIRNDAYKDFMVKAQSAGLVPVMYYFSLDEIKTKRMDEVKRHLMAFEELLRYDLGEESFGKMNKIYWQMFLDSKFRNMLLGSVDDISKGVRNFATSLNDISSSLYGINDTLGGIGSSISNIELSSMNREDKA